MATTGNHSLVFLTILVFFVCLPQTLGRTRLSSSGKRWHLQRIVQREPLTEEQLSSGGKKFDLSSMQTDPVRVYVIDTGINIEHEEFSGGRAVYGINIENPGAAPSDCNGHGTHVAALSVGKYSGVASNAVAVSVRAISCTGKGKCSDVIEALEWVLEDAKRNSAIRSIAIMSIGSISPTCAPTAAVTQLLWNNGIVITAAAGNNETDSCKLYPAKNAGTIAVGAIDKNDRVYKSNNYGDCIDLFAPGVDVVSAWGHGNDQYKIKTGTSMAAPIVAGIAALMLGMDQTLTANEVRSILISSSTRNRILNSNSAQVMTKSVNRLAYAPWGRLFEDIDMDVRIVEDRWAAVLRKSQFEYEDQDWNSSTTFISITIVLHPRVRPAMTYSVQRISSAMAQIGGIRQLSILPRRMRGTMILSNGSEPYDITLVFYIPMLLRNIAMYKQRYMQAHEEGTFYMLAKEEIKLPDEDFESGWRMNVTVPPRSDANDTFDDIHRLNPRQGLSAGAVIGIICAGVGVALLAIIFTGYFVFVPQVRAFRERRRNNMKDQDGEVADAAEDADTEQPNEIAIEV